MRCAMVIPDSLARLSDLTNAHDTDQLLDLLDDIKFLSLDGYREMVGLERAALETTMLGYCR